MNTSVDLNRENVFSQRNTKLSEHAYDELFGRIYTQKLFAMEAPEGFRGQRKYFKRLAESSNKARIQTLEEIADVYFD